MSIINLFRDFAISAHIKGANTKQDVQAHALANPGVVLILMGLVLALVPFGAAEAQTVSSVLGGLDGTIEAIVKFIMNASVVVGVLAIAYGIKLVIDKSNDRENVKNGHIVVSFVGGAMMCMLWFVVKMMTQTVGEDGKIGQFESW